MHNEFVTEFLDKANLFNDDFREQHRPVSNDISLLNNQNFGTVIRLSDFKIDTDTIINLIVSLDPNKSHSCDGISILSLKLCATSNSNALHILFSNNVINECFPSEWEKKANVISVH